MAGSDRTPAESLIEHLVGSPYAFDFHQAVRRLESQHPELPRVGASRAVREDAVRFGQEPSLTFAPSTIDSVVRGGAGLVHVRVSFMGLLGPNGPLPLHLTEYVYERIHHHNDATMARFLDVFHHRMLSLFHRAWAASRMAVSRDRPEEDRFAAYIGGLIGIGLDTLTDRDAVQDDAKLFFAGRLLTQQRNAEGLQAILHDYFQLPTRIKEFIGHWIDLPVRSHCRLGRSRANCCLGQNAFVGARTWDSQQRFRIIFGPVGFEDFERMLPTGRSHRRLLDWVLQYVGRRLSWELQLILRREEVPPIRLGGQGRLGWTTWLASGPLGREADDLVLHPRIT